ncbi:MAG: 3-deoxy-manno-octulosonate cytidylyltransferase [Hydrogenophaga sp.]|nr:3-deoxy-manno-octulosonate cytidylyltransferase [Hydrogenophaga sp.]
MTSGGKRPSGFTVVIPARLASTRLPEKILADLEGVPMVVRVARQGMLSKADHCVVAADDERIVDACQTHGVHAILTRKDHASGSDRLAEACEHLGLHDQDVVVNVQGDEPLMRPELINAVAQELLDRPDCVMSTAAHAIRDPEEFANPNVVKAVLDRRGDALYFSRAPIPFWRDGAARPGAVGSPSQTLLCQPAPLRHIGIYAYRAGFLRMFPKLEPAPLEHIEALEQLRVLWHGHRIAVHVTVEAPGPGVDTAADLEKVRNLLRR